MLSPSRHALFVLLTAAIALVPGLARGAEPRLARMHGSLLASPVWAGPSAVGLFEAGGSSALEEIELPGGTTRPIATVPHKYTSSRLLGSASLIAVQGLDVECFAVEEEGEGACRRPRYRVRRDDLLAVAPAAPPRCVFGAASESCLGPRPCELWVPEAQLSGTTFAYPRCEGTKETGTELLDTANPAGARVVAQVAEPEALAGEWLVGLTPGWRGGKGAAPALVEIDLRTGAETLHVAIDRPRQEIGFRFGGTFPAVAAVEADGTVAYGLEGRNGESSLWTATPGEAPRRLTDVQLNAMRRGLQFEDSLLQLAGGRVASTSPSDAEFVPLAGGAPTGLFTPWIYGFDFNGTLSLVAANPCGESFVGTWTPGGPEPLGPGGDCPAPHLLRASRYAHGLKLLVGCPARENLGCPPVRMTTSGTEPSPPGTYQPVFAADSDVFQMLPGTHRTVSVPLGRRALRWLGNPRRRISVGIEQVSDGERGEARVPEVRVRVVR